MKNRVMKSLCVLLVVAFLSGCATFKYVGDKDLAWKCRHFEATLPSGWTIYNAFGYYLYLTRDGLNLQGIQITHSKTNKELPNTKKKITEDMLLQEIAEVMIDEFELDQNYKNFEVASNRPVKLGGADAFRLEYSYSNDLFVKYSGITYGFVMKKKYYEVKYLATNQHYYQSGLKDFEAFIETFRLRKKDQ